MRACGGRSPTDGADIVHAHGLRAGLVAGWARPEHVPLVVTWHNAVLAGGLRGRAYHLLERRVARIADVTLALSADLVERAHRARRCRDVRLGAVAAPALGLPPARDPRRSARNSASTDGAPLVLSVGRLHPQKAYDDADRGRVAWRDRVPHRSSRSPAAAPSYLR